MAIAILSLAIGHVYILHPEMTISFKMSGMGHT